MDYPLPTVRRIAYAMALSFVLGRRTYIVRSFQLVRSRQLSGSVRFVGAESHGVGRGERERGDRRVEVRAVIAPHPVGALHRADRRGQHAARGVLERLTGIEPGLFADDAVA